MKYHQSHGCRHPELSSMRHVHQFVIQDHKESVSDGHVHLWGMKWPRA